MVLKTSHTNPWEIKVTKQYVREVLLTILNIFLKVGFKCSPFVFSINPNILKLPSVKLDIIKIGSTIKSEKFHHM